MNSDTQETLSLMKDAVLSRRRLKPMQDWVSYDECMEAAKQHYEEDHPGFAERHGKELQDFIITCAAGIAHQCAAEATRRAKGLV